MGLMFSCLDMSVVSTALVEISISLGNDYLNAPWVILAYLLTYMGESTIAHMPILTPSNSKSSICGGLFETQRHIRTPQYAHCCVDFLCRVLPHVCLCAEYDATVRYLRVCKAQPGPCLTA